MDNNAKEIAILLLKQQSGDLNTKEYRQLQTWLLSADQNQRLAKALEDATFIEEHVRQYNRITIPPPDIILRNALHPSKPIPVRHRFKRYLPYAASLLLVISAISSWFILNRNTETPSIQQVQTDISPGGNKATLILSNGEAIPLRSDQEGIAIGSHAIRYPDGESISHADVISYATLHVPRGGQYQLTLSDGTKVWLNSDTKLSYPTDFDTNERIVKLEGEAYFEVASNKEKPFSVEFTHHTVRVLGTSFNVNAHPDQQQSITTLVEGRIALETKDGLLKTLLPNQQAAASNQGIQIKRVNGKQYTMWKEGVIVLDRQDIQSIIPQLERWYDVEFDREGLPSRSLTLSGEIPRDISLSAVLAVLGDQLKLKFEIHDRRITIKS